MKALKARAQRRRATLWTLIVPPTVWALHFLFAYLFVAIRCAKHGDQEVIGDIRMWIGIATVAAFVPIVATALVSWWQMRRPGDAPPHDDSTENDRLRFLAVATLMLAALSLIAVIYTALPVLVLGDCR
ncbi:hypothetical protein [Coralloluteibacterium stylophorae]|uniref:Transmembrane protein n=1 Tax=Coralloluteibacterium stylophorae TaxID=1776034 RepID=A0A8J8AYL9_9GAMM|nr:hypothetical protein [Coralloluteibacterium stylophorae]MBS7457232.1 hypothetical protein [Coralloluteibacterium stylophorae]